jgi:quercetin dioxygenase-like cupin family protein
LHVVRSDGGALSVVDAPIFRGTVRVRELAGGAQTEQLRVILVRFDAGSVNVPHTHSFDQVLFIVEGKGIVANEEAEHHVGLGDLVVIPAGERHWHGATPEAAMAHLAFGLPGTTDIVEDGGRS